MKKIALTGAAGYLGRKLLTLLDHHPDVEKVLCIDRQNLPAEIISERIVYHRADICAPGLEQTLKEHAIDTVIHLAFIFNPIRDVRKMHAVNVGGTQNLLRAAAQSGAAHFILASSTSAFGAYADNPALLTESDPLRRHTGYTYAEDKYDVEMMARAFMAEQENMSLAVVRPCIIYGPGVDNYLSRFVLNWPFLFQVGQARPLMQFVHEDDVALAFMRVVEKGIAGTFHVAGDGFISTTEIAALAGIKILALPAWLLYPLVNLLYLVRFPGIEAPANMLDFIRYRWTVSDSMTREKIGFSPQYSSKEVIGALVEKKIKAKN